MQACASSDAQKNVEKTGEAVARAAARGARIICTQELFRTPYFCREQEVDHFDLAEPIPGPTTEVLQCWARQHGVVLVGSLFEKRAPGIYHNTAVVIDADGTLLGVYRKMHIPQDPGFEEKFYFTPGDRGFPVWDTAYGRIGVLICWDQWFPEAARLAGLRGAEIIFYPTAIGWLADEKESLGGAQYLAWETIQRSHGIANGCYVASINRTGIEQSVEFWGRSFVSDPYGQVVAQAPTGCDFELVYEIDRRAIEDFRRIWPFFRDRRIDAYSDLCQRMVDPRPLDGVAMPSVYRALARE